MMIQEFDDLVSFEPASKPVGFILLIDDEQRLVKEGPNWWVLWEVCIHTHNLDDEGAMEFFKMLQGFEADYPINWMEEIK